MRMLVDGVAYKMNIDFTKISLSMVNTCYGHLSVITGYKWDYTFYKWGFISTYNW